jgi:hypothetical protein
VGPAVAAAEIALAACSARHDGIPGDVHAYDPEYGYITIVLRREEPGHRTPASGGGALRRIEADALEVCVERGSRTLCRRAARHAEPQEGG